MTIYVRISLPTIVPKEPFMMVKLGYSSAAVVSACALSFISFLFLPLPDASTVFVVLLSNILSLVFILPILSFFDKIIASVLISY